MSLKDIGTQEKKELLTNQREHKLFQRQRFIHVSILRSNTKQDLSVLSNLYVNNILGITIPLK